MCSGRQWAAEILAGELGANVALAKRAGLLHDIGKSVDHEAEGTHVELGVEILKRYKESDAVINAVHAHHGDTEPTTMEAVLIQAADALKAEQVCHIGKKFVLYRRSNKQGIKHIEF